MALQKPSEIRQLYDRLYYDDAVSWSDVPLWEAVFDDASAFRRKFQEIGLAWDSKVGRTNKKAPSFKLRAAKQRSPPKTPKSTFVCGLTDMN